MRAANGLNSNAVNGLEGQEGPGEVDETVALATGCADGTAAVWSAKGKLLRKLEGHTDRLGRVAFHPMGQHLVSGWDFVVRGSVQQWWMISKIAYRLW